MFDKKEEENKGPSLYSNSQTDVAIRAVAQAADPGSALKSFRTKPFNSLGEGWERWLVATRKPRTKAWTVIQIEQRGPGSRTQEPVVTSATFFDALHFCALFESTAPGRGLTESPVAADMRGITYYRVAADKANLPLDRDGLPHPAANGLPLTKGDFDEFAYAVAARTAGADSEAAVPQATDGQFLDDLFEPSPDLPPAEEGDFLENSIKKYQDAVTQAQDEKKRAEAQKRLEEETRKLNKKLCKQFTEVRSLASAIEDNVENYIRYPDRKLDRRKEHVGALAGVAKYMGGYAGTVAAVKGSAVLMASFLPAAAVVLPWITLPSVVGGVIIGNSLSSTLKASDVVDLKCEDLAKKAANLPDCEEKSLTMEFARAAKATFDLGHVSVFQDRIAEGKEGRRALEKVRDEGMALIDGAGKSMQWAEADIQRLKDQFKQGRFPDTYYFTGKLKKRYSALDNKLYNKITPYRYY